MKRFLNYSILAGALLAGSTVLWAQPVYTLDPPQPINDYISLGEFNTNGNLEGWGHNASAVKTEVINGVLKVTTTSGDPWFYRAGIAGLPTDFTTVQVRLRIVQGERNGWEMFWGQTGATGFSGDRRIAYNLGFDDNEYHLLEYEMSAALNDASLTDFRIDCGQNAGNVIEIDYVRVGKISFDSDGDGLPDSVETSTGVYVSPRDTGTRPDQADTDNDGVSDGQEVQYGTDPNDPTKFPVPSIDRYSENPAIYVVEVPIAINWPTVSMGTPTSFQIDPALPAGLFMDSLNGMIFGTPTAVSPKTDYSVVATFSDNKKATNVLSLEVRNPYIDFTVDTYAFKKDTGFANIIPNVHGPVPLQFSVQPNLPEGLSMDLVTGTISGTGIVYSNLTVYTVTATYQGFPDSSADISIAILLDPTATVDPQTNVVDWFSLGEFADPTEATNFFRNSMEPLAIAEGIATVVTTGGDPYFGRNFTLANDYRVLEFRMKVVAGGTPFRFYWSEDAPGRGMSEATSWPLNEVIADGEFHVYQVDFTSSIIGPFTAFRLDTADSAGTTLEFDYIRLGSMTLLAKPSLSITQPTNGVVRVSWPANAEGYTLYSTTNLVESWIVDSTTVTTDGTKKYIDSNTSGISRFFRLQK